MKIKGNSILRILFVLACLSSTFSFTRNVNDWQVTSKWCGLLACTLLLLVYLAIRQCFKLNDDFRRNIIVFFSAVMISVNLLLSGVCILQYFGIIERGIVFPAISDFDNPAGVAAFLCMTFPFCVPTINRDNGGSPFVSSLFVADIFVLFLIGSRTGLIAMSLSMVIYIIYQWRSLGRNNLYAIMFVLALLIVSLLFLFNQKTASNDGRRMILDVCLTMFRDSPWLGWGRHGFASNYMIYQAEYLSSVFDSDLLLLSDNVKHPLCEYVLLLVNYGLIGFGFVMAVILVFVRMLVRDDMYKPFVLMIAVSLAVLSGFSYPFRYPMTLLSICIVVFFVWNEEIKEFLNTCGRFVGVSAISAILVLMLYWSVPWMRAQFAWGKVTSSLLSDRSSAKVLKNEIIPAIDRHLFDNPRYRYSRAVVNYYSGFLEEALTDALASSECLSSYDTELLLGDICSALGRYQESEQHYLMASRMCPSKIAPQYCLFKLYELSGEEDAQRRIGNELLNKPVKIMNEKAKAMRLEVRMIMALPQSADF